jgi:hypothetical protein
VIDRIAAPQLAAILALSVVYRRPTNVRRVLISGVAPTSTAERSFNNSTGSASSTDDAADNRRRQR